MTTLVQRKNSKKAASSSANQTFNRLRKQVEAAQIKLCDTKKYLDACLAYYYEHGEPAKSRLVSSLNEMIKVMFHYYETAKLTKKQRPILKDMIFEKIERLLCHVMYSDLDEEICRINKELDGVDLAEEYGDELDTFKSEVEMFCQEMGVKIDLDNLNIDDDQNELMEKFMNAFMDSAKDKIENIDSKPQKPKSKKEIEREEKAKKLELLQKNGIGNIYKQLAKAFHPDLEQCPVRKIECVEMMKKLTVAYENNDLHTLLSLELEWLSRSEKERVIHSNEELKIYNSILKEQIEELKMQMEMLLLAPKYLNLQRFLHGGPDDVMPQMKEAIDTMELEQGNLHEILIDLKGKDGLKTLKEGIKIFSAAMEFSIDEINFKLLSQLFNDQ